MLFTVPFHANLPHNMTRSPYPYVERSMHQGTSLRLEQERVASEGQLADAEERLGAGLAPSAEAEDQFRRMRVVWQRRAGEAGGSAAMQDRNTAVAAGLVRTTAEPRPNACVVVLCAWRPLLPIAARALPPTWRICAEAARSPPHLPPTYYSYSPATFRTTSGFRGHTVASHPSSPLSHRDRLRRRCVICESRSSARLFCERRGHATPPTPRSSRTRY